jgi:hypothetical protein
LVHLARRAVDAGLEVDVAKAAAAAFGDQTFLPSTSRSAMTSPVLTSAITVPTGTRR